MTAAAWTERSATLDDATDEGRPLLMRKRPKLTQKFEGEGQLERLRAHTARPSTAPFAMEIRRTLVEELRALTAASRACDPGVRCRKSGVPVCCAAPPWSPRGCPSLHRVLPIGVARWTLPSAAEIVTLRSRRDELAANLAKFEQQGGRIDWRRQRGRSAPLCPRGPQGAYFMATSRRLRRYRRVLIA